MPNPENLKAQMERVALELLEGRGAHADSLGCIEDISAELASRKPAGFEHSIFEIVSHLSYWMEADLKRMRGTPDPYPAHASESWPESSATSEGSWEACVARFSKLRGEFASFCRADAASWTATAALTYPSHERNASSIGALIFQAIAHNSYHLGQIVDLRRALGAWPPAKGGDTGEFLQPPVERAKEKGRIRCEQDPPYLDTQGITKLFCVVGLNSDKQNGKGANSQG